MHSYTRIYQPLTNRFIFEREQSLSPAVTDVTDKWPAQNSVLHDRSPPNINQKGHRPGAPVSGK